MGEDEHPRKERWLKRSSSNPDLPKGRGRRPTSDTLSLPPSRNESRNRFLGPISKFIGKVASRSPSSARQSPNPEPTAASSSPQDTQPVQLTKDPSLLTAPALKPGPKQSSNSGIAGVVSINVAGHPDPKSVNDRIADATKGVAGMKNVAAKVQNAASATGNLQSVPDTMSQFSVILGTLKTFHAVAHQITNLHPYAKVALGILTQASKMILDQAKLDVAVSDLLSKVSDVYVLVTEKQALANISSMMKMYTKIAEQTLKCAEFIVHYSETKSFGKRLVKHVFRSTDAEIRGYSDILDGLMQQFRNQVARDAAIILDDLAKDRDLSSMEYVAHAGLDASKCCLENTRVELLTKIKLWIGSTGEGVARVLWLSGTAGKGKSAIAHTIANWSRELGGLGACFCFDRTRVADRRHEKIFTTIARDLADCNPIMRKALAHVLHIRNKDKRTIDISRQWQELVVGPVGEASRAINAPVLIIIDALDESGDHKSREQILRMFAGDPNATSSQLSQLPANFRIIITSRPLEDIGDALRTASHVRHISMDEISVESTERDIQSYISSKLLKVPRLTFNDEHFKTLAQKSDGLFEWARLACDYIKGTNKVGVDPMRRCEAVIAGTSSSKKATYLLDDMYRRILADIMPEDKEAITMFRSVMAQIIASLEPLPMTALAIMRMRFPHEEDRYKVDRVIGPMGSLLTGTTNRHTLIRPLHASFYEFLTEKSRSHDFFVDTSSVQTGLAFASLRTMERHLCFNICSLESSYLPNSDVPHFAERVKKSISVELSYSCRFWGTHVGATSFKSSLAMKVKAFFDGERLLWWLEALALMKSLGGSVDSLLSIAGWVAGHADYTHIGNAARDTVRFVRTFAPTILRSTPHLYLSALPLAPTQSRIYRKFAAKFPCTPRIVAGHVINWPQMEKTLPVTHQVFSVAMSPDGKRIACGLYGGTIQVLDTETGEAQGAPLQGHTDCVASITFSPDGKYIVSGSWDKTVRVRDVVTGKSLGSPLHGHTSKVTSVAISSNGSHIVSGSYDNTVRVWDVGIGEASSSPLRGHTSYVSSVAISSNGRRIVSGSSDRTVRVWDMETGKALGVPLGGHIDCVKSVAISPDGKHIVSGSDDKTIRVWDMETGKAFGAPLRGHTGSVRSVTLSSDGHRIISGSSDQTIRVWDMKIGNALGSPLQGHTSDVMSVAMSRDGNRIVSGSNDKTIRVWDADTITGDADTITGNASVAALQRHTASVNSVAISPDGKCIVSGSDDKTARIWDLGTGKALLAPLQGHTGSVQSVAISSNRRRIVSSSKDKTVRIWDMGTGEPVNPPLRGYSDYVLSAISPNGRHIVAGSGDKTIRMWDIETRKESGNPLKGRPVRVESVAISSNGNHIVSGSDDKTIQVWDMRTGRASSARLRGHTDLVLSITISPDGRRIVSGSLDRTIRVWDMETSKALSTALRGHTGRVNTVAISSDGKRIVSGSSDQTVRVWDMQTGEAMGVPFQGHTGSVMSVAISPDGKYIVSGSQDKTIRVWDLDFFHRDQLSKIRFSPNPTHALRSASSFLQNSKTPAPYGPNEEGWVVGPEGRLLLYISPVFPPVMFAHGKVLVIPNNINALQLDLSCVVHGTSWHKCRKKEAVPPL